MTPGQRQAIAKEVASNTCGCALERATDGMKSGSTSDKAVLKFGISRAEAFGIMNGWDEAARPGSGCFGGWRSDPGFVEGAQFGRELYSVYGVES